MKNKNRKFFIHFTKRKFTVFEKRIILKQLAFELNCTITLKIEKIEKTAFQKLPVFRQRRDCDLK